MIWFSQFLELLLSVLCSRNCICLNCDTSIIVIHTPNNGLYFYKVNYMYLVAIYSSNCLACVCVSVCNTIKIYKTCQLKNWDYSKLECKPSMFLIPNILQLSIHFFNQHLSWICKKVAHFFHSIKITNLISKFGWS